MTIWLIGGTSESKHLAIALSDQKIPFIVSVATESACSLYPSMSVAVGRLDRTSMKTFIRQHQVAAILDASHPFATEVSQTAIAEAQELHLPYLRFERAISPSQSFSPWRIEFASFDRLIESDCLRGQRVLLTVGCQPLHLFLPWQDRSHLFARVLPSSQAIATALKAGFAPDRLIALRPPITRDLEKALWQHWQITTVVTKASGTPGGETIKHSLAEELQIRLLVVNRPSLIYPYCVSSLAECLQFCQQIYR